MASIRSGVGRSSHAACGSVTGGDVGGFAVCNGPGSAMSFANHLVSFYANTFAVENPFVGCNGSGCSGADPSCGYEVWIWLD